MKERTNELVFKNKILFQNVARFCNRYPNIELSYEVEDKDGIKA